ncbi:serine/threonine protein phosphatase [Paenibacillus oralis]|uniref:Serine/threonine protein phosphatase n=1 Tax=Paenibacillus oralis TaxID=2490856 RepID=A0A3P3TW78_9BACL|nr:metallophosphoesterase [Paenibacillus oralis]RRJ61956.1 serine/threonine protein phosphatase [Paenibacillus oralis]
MNPLTHRSRLLAISDIHGHGEGLKLLLAASAYDARRDQLILLGDYINADPDTWGTLEQIQQLTLNGATALLGNLEMGLLKKAGSIPETLVPPARLDWLNGLPFYVTVGSWLFVHAGIRPGRSLEQQSPEDLTGIREDFWNAAPDCGYTVVFGHTPTFKLGAKPGAIWQAPGRLGIDTGAKHGERLTLLDLTGGTAYSCSTLQASLYGDLRIEAVSLPESL